MMTGQLLSGVSPLEAVKYQIVILALIATTTTVGCLLAVWLTFQQSFSKWEAIVVFCSRVAPQLGISVPPSREKVREPSALS